jgi:hypothetical protein
MKKETKFIPSGPAAAAMISAGIGIMVIGILTTAAEMSEGLSQALNLYSPTGPLSGKTGFGVVAWLLSWLILGQLWKDKTSDLQRSFIITLVLAAIGLLLTFPPLFALLEG